MADFVVWGILAVLLVLAELVSGTFYLLMVAVGAAAGGVAAWSGLSAVLQCTAAAVVGGIAIVLLRRSRWGHRRGPGDAGANPDVLLDVGQTVEVLAWHDGAARVRYRGSDWDAVPEAPDSPATGALIIKAIRGSTLVLGRH